MSDSVIHLTKDTFDAEVARFEGSALVDFWAPWCGFCKMLEPVLDEIAAESSAFKVCKVNVDDEPDLAERFGVMALPTLLAFKGGKETGKLVGSCSKDELLAVMGESGK